MQCNELALRWTLCHPPHLQIENTDWGAQPTNLNNGEHLRQTLIFLTIHSAAGVPAKYSTVTNQPVTAVKYKIFQPNKVYINITWHMLPSVQTLAGHRGESHLGLKTKCFACLKQTNSRFLINQILIVTTGTRAWQRMRVT